MLVRINDIEKSKGITVDKVEGTEEVVVNEVGIVLEIVLVFT